MLSLLEVVEPFSDFPLKTGLTCGKFPAMSDWRGRLDLFVTVVYLGSAAVAIALAALTRVLPAAAAEVLRPIIECAFGVFVVVAMTGVLYVIVVIVVGGSKLLWKWATGG